MRRPRPAKPSTSTIRTKESTSTAVMTVDTYTDIIRCPSPIPLDKPPYTIPAEKDSCLPHLEPPVTPPTKSLQRPPIKRGPSSNLMTRWNRVDVPDSVLIAELEELRRIVELANDESPADNHGFDFRCNSCTWGSPSQDDDRRWKKAQKSAFCRRELIKTELTYLEAVLQLENKTVSKLPTHVRPKRSSPTVSIAATRSPLGLPSSFDCGLLSAAGSFPLRSNDGRGRVSLH